MSNQPSRPFLAYPAFRSIFFAHESAGRGAYLSFLSQSAFFSRRRPAPRPQAKIRNRPRQAPRLRLWPPSSRSTAWRLCHNTIDLGSQGSKQRSSATRAKAGQTDGESPRQRFVGLLGRRERQVCSMRKSSNVDSSGLNSLSRRLCALPRLTRHIFSMIARTDGLSNSGKSLGNLPTDRPRR